MKSHLSHILPVAEACAILEESTVRRIVRSFLTCRSPKLDPQEEISVMKALTFNEEEVPSHIQATWNKYTKRTMGLDKLTLLKWLMPMHASPHVGPGGHLGLYDCLVHALSSSANHHSSSSATSSGGVVLTPVVLLPDLLITMAISKEYAHAASSVNLDEEDNEYAIMMLSVLAFRVYDSYQKKGMVSRDTIHRFLQDVYGDDSYKRPEVRAILDKMFSSSEETGGALSIISGSQFCHGIAATSDGVSHVLLDWLAKLIIRLIPPGELPLSAQAYLETIGSSHRSVERLCQDYGLAEASRLYEIKRRFHSLVESSNVIHGDPMSVDVQEQSRPRHVITEKAFCKAVSLPNSDMGHGGYLPESIAALTFQAACSSFVNDREEDEGDDPEMQAPEGFWALFDVLQFGCQAVRRPISGKRDENMDLLKFAFRVFGLLPGELTGHKVLTRTQVGHMLALLLEHAEFRRAADSPSTGEEEVSKRIVTIDGGDIEETMIVSEEASSLGILPPTVKEANVPLRVSIDYVMGDKDTLSFDAFCRWNSEASSQQRLGPYLLELRLISAILFGVPPSHASIEKRLVEEVQQRHKNKYPQTDASRRGPRGTIWYIMDDSWYRSWSTHVERVSGTDQDVADNREQTNASPRGLTTINNKGLLAANGSLALRADIKWRHDYEIIAPMAWSALQAWYDGGPPIHRTVVPYIPTTGAPSPHSRVPRVRTAHEIELYPYFVTVFLCDTLSRGEARPFQQYVPLSRVSPVRMLLLQLCKGLEIDPKYGRLWMVERAPSKLEGGERQSSDWLLNLDENVVEQLNRRGSSAGLDNGISIVLLLELKDNETELWPRGADGKTWTFQEEGRDGVARQNSGIGDGVVGLYNMGNSCYMNSSIQCLSHTPVFREYVNSKAYLNDINTTNPLGHEGRLAQVSAVLINSLWKTYNQSAIRTTKQVTAPGSYAMVNAPALTPKTFKESLGKFNDHFAGNEQHDAQELLAFLLAGLSEDLNRIVDKPYIEAPDSDGRPDSELADIWWANHLKREMSIIVALFTGQYKSLLTCRSCKYESARFEPFLFLQLPLPEDDEISVPLILYPRCDGEEPLKYSVRVRHNGLLQDVLMSLAKVLHADEIAEETGSQSTETKPTKHKASKDQHDDEPNPELEAKYKQMAENMAVVDMRDGYILKIAPNSWALPDLQNKDTGELPLLHVYQLEPLPEGEKAVVNNERQKGEEVESDPVEEVEAKQADESSDHTDSEGESHVGDGLEAKGDENADNDAEADRVKEDEEVKNVITNGGKIPNDEFSNAKRVQLGSEPISTAENKESLRNPGVKFSFLALAQRKTEMISGELLHPFSHHVFGTPLLLRVVDLEGYSGRDLYDLVAKRLRNFVPKSALRFLADNRDAPRAEEEPEEDDQDAPSSKPRPGSRKRRHRTTSDMEEVAAGPVPRYGFRLRLSCRDGKRCALCPWYECCIGCLVPDDDYPTIVTCGDSLVIDWHFAVDIATSGFGFRANSRDYHASQSPVRAKQMVVPVKNHSSCGADGKKKGYAGAITLEDCLDAFAEEERIPEAYCSRCKDFRVQTKRMSLWRLPPVVIIHLKRFQFTQHARRKLRDLVTFPIEGLDLSRIMASDDPLSTTIKLPNPAGKVKKHSSKLEKDETDQDNTTDEEDESSRSFGKDNGRSVKLYDLYGVIHHQGALSGGHYVASLKSEIDGQWRLFNDAQIFEIHSRDVVDASAYILFYIRRDVKEAKLDDFWDAAEGEGVTEEEMNKLIKGRSERCVIS